VLLGLLVAAHAQARQAALSIPEVHAADAAEAVLREGGNAVDAAVATAFALAVTLPDAGNIGGGGFMTLFVDGEARFLDYRETAPAAATRDMYLDDAGQVVSDASLVGHRASGVPGTVAGLWEAHRRYGRLPWARLLQPAIRLAEEGFIVPGWFRDEVVYGEDNYGDRTNFRDYYGHARTGERFRQPELAATLKRLAGKGPDDFYRGETAKLIVAEMARGGGLITAADLAAYRPEWRSPLVATWHDHEVVTAPPPSSGGLAIIQYLGMKDALGPAFANLDHNSVPYLHLKAEIEKRIFADRAEHLGDPGFVDVPVAELTDRDYLRRRAAQVNPTAPTPTGDVEAWREAVHTTHFSILDGEGNAVSNTYTLNTSFGSGVVVEGAGFLLNNEMDDFSVAPGVANYYGVVGDDANAIAGGKRMLSSMAPTLLLRDGDVALVVGAMGGSTIFTTIYQVISNVLEFGMSVDEAQAAPRVHHQLVPDQLITYSPGTPLPEATIRGLEDLGYRVEPHFFEFGNVQLIRVDEEGQVSAAADPRFAGEARVVDMP
jgi:gamma-glutamyltranspeptidase/glutathione hydrolase